MPIESNELWREQRSERTAEGWNLYRGWKVVNVPADATDAEILAATPIDGAAHKIPAMNAGHPLNTFSTVRELPIGAGDGPFSRTVRAVYAVAPLGGWSDGATSPLAQQPEISSDWMFREEIFDRDADGVPVLNAAGFPFDPLPTREVMDFGATFSRYEPVFPMVKAFTFGMSCNDANVTLPGYGMIGPEQGLLRPMRHDPFQLASAYVRVHYTIWCRENGWRTFIRNEGAWGWGQKQAGNPLSVDKGRFCNQSGQAIDDQILLDASGRPLVDPTKTKVKVSESTFADPQVPPTGRIISGAWPNYPAEYLDVQPGTGIIRLKFKRYRLKNWSGLFD